MYRQLGPADAAAVRQHYLSLCPFDRSMRFGVAKSDEAVARYCAAIDWRNSRLIGYFARNRLRGLIELSTPLSAPSRAREVAIVVAPGWRRRGIGKGLIRYAVDAQGGRCDRFLFFWQHGNDGFAQFLTACGGVADQQRGLGWIELSALPCAKAYARPKVAGGARHGAFVAL